MSDEPSPVEDRRKDTFKMEPLLVGGVGDRALTLAQKAAAFRGSLPQGIVESLADLVRAMNCYYSNLIEGHNTLPIDIERARNNDYSKDKTKRDLQLEAAAHIAVQEWIDAGGLAGPATDVNSIREIHRRFCEKLPDDLLYAEDPDTNQRIRVVPGELRRRDVRVGRHVPVSPGAVPRFLRRFAEVYGRLDNLETIVAAAAAHHRLVWIHPFIDGNGRVARLMSHAMLSDKLESGSLWSVARGLARTVNEYKSHLAACDEPRRGDLDGRGNLSQAALVDFTRYFLDTCIDQVDFMKNLVKPAGLRARIHDWIVSQAAAQKSVSLRAMPILDALLLRGELPRGEVAGLVGTTDRQARRYVAGLTKIGAVRADTPSSPLRLAFSATLAPHWMPDLFPATAVA